MVSSCGSLDESASKYRICIMCWMFTNSFFGSEEFLLTLGLWGLPKPPPNGSFHLNPHVVIAFSPLQLHPTSPGEETPPSYTGHQTAT